MPECLAKFYEPHITQVIIYFGTIYKHHPNEGWFILGTVPNQVA